MKEQVNEKKPISKKVIIIVSVVIVTFVAGVLALYFSYIKPEHEGAIAMYSKSVQEYTLALSNFDAKCERFESVNVRLENEITDLQDVITYGGDPYDKDTIIVANDAINQGKVALQEVPVLDFEREIKQADDFFFLQINGVKEQDAIVKERTEKLNKLTEETIVPDYTEATTVIDTAQTNLENSIRQLEQVTAPSESYVLGRIMEIKDEAGMVDVIALTEDTDPENLIGKNGWYTSKIIFRHKDVKHYGLDNGLKTLAEIGNPAGGCVETYATVEDAERRNQELTDMEGTVRSPGAHFVCGTMVVRISEDMKTSTQNILLEMIIDALLRLEE